MRLAVAGGKGGVGVSTVAYNLGAELDAVVVDADLTMADLPDGGGPDLHDVLAGRAEAREAVREGGPVDVLPCGRTLAGSRAADPTALGDAIEVVAGAYGAVVVDAPTGRGPGAALALQATQACVLVTTPRSVAVADAASTRTLARQLEAALLGIVINRAGLDPPIRAAEATLGGPATAVPESAAVASAMARGLPVGVAAPDATASARFETIAGAVQQSLRS